MLLASFSLCRCCCHSWFLPGLTEVVLSRLLHRVLVVLHLLHELLLGRFALAFVLMMPHGYDSQD